MILQVSKTNFFKLDEKNIAPDKSISHRSAIFSLLSDKPSLIKNYLQGEDTLNTLNIATKLGLTINKERNNLLLIPPKKIKEPDEILDCGNAGTAIRLYLGLLSTQKGMFVLSGDRYLNQRPMKRVVDPLRQICANILGRNDGN
ncbi:MAG: 3-phosphoshikimate 1-carboxyvinyltransferase, partial [Helicobacter sp.]|nr:3-phosphoshikimate 1-carboxyvinyltransferase [Helicobacter sp.]